MIILMITGNRKAFFVNWGISITHILFHNILFDYFTILNEDFYLGKVELRHSYQMIGSCEKRLENSDVILVGTIIYDSNRHRIYLY
jgi:hypothetical protein